MISSVPDGYDWRRIVAENKPGTDSMSQRARLELLPHVTDDLTDWATRYDLWMQRVGASAYTGVVSTKPSRNADEALLVARCILWIYSLDNYIDRYQLVHADRTGTAPHIQAQLAAAVTPLLEMADFGIDPGLQSNLVAVDAPDATTLLLSEGLKALFHDLSAATDLQRDDSHGLGFARANFGRQLVRMIDAWREEAIESLSVRCAPRETRLSNLEAYLERGSISISFMGIASVPTCFEEAPEQAWSTCGEAMASGARIARLCNDIGSYEAEIDEGRVNAVTLALAQLGLDPFRRFPERSEEVARAKGIVYTRLEQEVARFGQLSSGLPEGHLGFWVRTMPAFALAMYEGGNYVPPT